MERSGRPTSVFRRGAYAFSLPPLRLLPLLNIGITRGASLGIPKLWRNYERRNYSDALSRKIEIIYYIYNNYKIYNFNFLYIILFKIIIIKFIINNFNFSRKCIWIIIKARFIINLLCYSFVAQFFFNSRW